MENMNVVNTLLSLPHEDSSQDTIAINNDSSRLHNEREAYDRALSCKPNSYIQREEKKARRKMWKKELAKTQVANRIIQLFVCRMCNQISTSQQVIEEHTKVCMLIQHQSCEQEFSSLKSYLKVKWRCVCTLVEA